MSVEPRNPGQAPPPGVSEPIDLVAEIKRRRRTLPSSASEGSTAPNAPERSSGRDRESEFALGRASRYSLAGALGLDEPDSPDDVLDALEEQTTAQAALVDEDRSPTDTATAGMSGEQWGEDAIGERLHRHHELTSPRPATDEALRGSAQLAPAHVRRPVRPRGASVRGPLRARLSESRARPRHLFRVLAVAGIAAALATTVVLIAGERSVPRQARQTVAVHPATATVPFGQSLFSLMARVRGDVAAEGQAAARVARERAQHQARQRRARELRRTRAQRRQRALARRRATASRHATPQPSTPVSPSSGSAGGTIASSAAPATVTVTTPAAVCSSPSSSQGSAPAGPTGVGSSSGGCDPKCG